MCDNTTDKCYEILNNNDIKDDSFRNTFKYPFDNIAIKHESGNLFTCEITRKSDNFSKIIRTYPTLHNVDNNIITKLNVNNFFSYITKIHYFNGVIYSNEINKQHNDYKWYLICELKVDNFIFYCYYTSYCDRSGFSIFDNSNRHNLYFSTNLKNLVCYALDNYVKEMIVDCTKIKECKDLSNEEQILKCYELLNNSNEINNDIFANTFKYPFDFIEGNFSKILRKSPMLYNVDNNTIKKLNSKNFFSYITKIHYFSGIIHDIDDGCPGDNSWYLICELKVDNVIFHCYYASYCCYTGFEVSGSHNLYSSTDLKNLVFYALEDCVRTDIINAFNK